MLFQTTRKKIGALDGGTLGRLILAVVVGAASFCGVVVAGIKGNSTMVLACLLILAEVVVLSKVHWLIGLNRKHEVFAQEVGKASDEREQYYITILKRVVHAWEARDPFTAGHSDRVGRMAMQLSKRMGLSEEICAKMEIAGYLHDIGMIAIPEQMLATAGKLSVSDFRVMQKHSEVGFEVLSPLETLGKVLPAVRYHHERINGTGYPAGLKGADIPIEAKILSVVDAFDAMTHDRPYRGAMSPSGAVKELRRCTPAGYDQDCVDNLCRMLHLDIELDEVKVVKI